MSTSNDDFYERLSELARQMSQRLPDSSAGAIDDLIANAVQHIPAAKFAGITVVSNNGDVATPASTGEYPRILDMLQQKHHEGPCFDAATDNDNYFIADLHTETRWPQFCSDAMAFTPIQAIASYRLFSTHDTVGALNLYAERPDAFGQHDRDLGFIFAAHASVIWAAVQRREHFRSALADRDTLAQAKGMVMERYKLNPIQAFELLHRLSQDTNTSLAALARCIVENDDPTNTP